MDIVAVHFFFPNFDLTYTVAFDIRIWISDYSTFDALGFDRTS